MNKVPLTELNDRMERFKKYMEQKNPDWEIAVIFSNINLYYFTGTMQDGILIIPRDQEATLWVRRNYERALTESLFPNIQSMRSFRDAASEMSTIPEEVYLETEIVPLALYQRFQKHFPFREFKSLDLDLAKLRSVKSEYELNLMEKAGQIHQHVLEDIVPEILEEGMSEVDLETQLFTRMVEEGHHGVTRFGMFDTEIQLGLVCFGESSIYPSYFNSPGGNCGTPAVPLFGSRDRKLKKGDLVFIDVGCGFEGYNTDKTMTYVFEGSLPQHAIDAHHECVRIQNDVAKMLKQGAVPSEIFNDITGGLEPDFMQNFMGFGQNQVGFLGHGIGLLIDELPVIAPGFDEPLQEGMVFAVEPKKGIKDVGLVGIENTFVVTPNGGKCITGDNPGLMPVFK